LQIKLENEEKPSIRTIYFLSAVEQEALKDFIYENLNTGFIQLISFPYRAPVLFVKKKDGFLHLCINFQELNYITWKGKYPLPLISGLLDFFQKTYIYIKINL